MILVEPYGPAVREYVYASDDPADAIEKYYSLSFFQIAARVYF